MSNCLSKPFNWVIITTHCLCLLKHGFAGEVDNASKAPKKESEFLLLSIRHSPYVTELCLELRVRVEFG
jgi:hypothetical protein